MVSENIFRQTVCVLLGGILLCLIGIFAKMPPTLGEYQTAPKEAKKQMLMKAPIVHSKISEPLEVHISNEPLQVHIANEPLEVTIER